MTAIFWFTADLRLQDHPALSAAINNHAQVVPVFILDEKADWSPGAAKKWWLHQSLERLQKAIEEQGGQLILRRGNPVTVLLELAKTLKAEAVYFSRAYEPDLAEQQHQLQKQLEARSISCKGYSGRLLYEPEYIRTNQGTPFKVFSAYYRHCQKLCSIPFSTRALKFNFVPNRLGSDTLAQWQLLPTRPNWAKPFEALWQPGFAGAEAALQRTLDEVVANYDECRDRPAVDGTSRLSPHLAHGEISPWQVWQAVDTAFSSNRQAAEPFLRQLAWRDFSYYLLRYFPDLPSKPFNPKFGAFPWRQSQQDFSAWTRGQTGYPLVDAGMRQLWHTGWMHNRIRMVVASFLCKHLRINWREGSAWFWDTLLDADLANNAFGWQWVAGSGADAAPYFRVFNPVLQGEKFDPQGDYVRRWVPELAGLPKKYLHKPWEAPVEVLEQADVRLGLDYPYPIVEHGQARAEALEAYALVRAAAG